MHYQGSHRDWKTWPKVMEFCYQSWKFTNFSPKCTKFVCLFAITKTLSINAESSQFHFLQTPKWSWKSHGKIFCQVCRNPDYICAAKTYFLLLGGQFQILPSNFPTFLIIFKDFEIPVHFKHVLIACFSWCWRRSSSTWRVGTWPASPTLSTFPSNEPASQTRRVERAG